MKRSKTQFKRLTDLTERIRDSRQPVNCLILAKEWEVSQKTAQRDIDYLRDQLHAPIEYDRLRKSYYFTEPTWSMPALVVSEGEILAVLLGSRVLEQYHGTPVAKHEKLAELLPEKVRIRPEDMFNRFSFRCPPARAVTPENWAAVIRGLCEQKSLKMFYRKAEVTVSEPAKESLFNPYHVANLQGEWYMFGVYAGQTDVRQFSMARIEKATVTAAAFTVPADFDSEKLLADTFGRFSGQHDSHKVRLLFSKEAAQWVEDRELHPQQVLRRQRSGALELTFPAKGIYEVQQWVLGWGHGVKVLEPKALRDAVQAEIRLMAKGVGRA